MVKLASDVDNSEFTGAHNPDSRLAVKFYKKLMVNNFKSSLENRPIHEECDYIQIHVPGDSTTVIDRPVREGDKQRFPMHWARYQNDHADLGIIGTPLNQWPQISASVAEDLKHFKFHTVESIANASDQQINSIGMAGGMQGYALRERAKTFLQVAAGNAEANKHEVELNEVKAQNAALEGSIKALQEQLAQMQEDKPKRGRPAKAQ